MIGIQTIKQRSDLWLISRMLNFLTLRALFGQASGWHALSGRLGFVSPKIDCLRGSPIFYGKPNDPVNRAREEKQKNP